MKRPGNSTKFEGLRKGSLDAFMRRSSARGDRGRRERRHGCRMEGAVARVAEGARGIHP
jgi:hypothetical protein